MHGFLLWVHQTIRVPNECSCNNLSECVGKAFQWGLGVVKWEWAQIKMDMQIWFLQPEWVNRRLFKDFYYNLMGSSWMGIARLCLRFFHMMCNRSVLSLLWINTKFKTKFKCIIHIQISYWISVTWMSLLSTHSWRIISCFLLLKFALPQSKSRYVSALDASPVGGGKAPPSWFTSRNYSQKNSKKETGRCCFGSAW